jgi:hypothetical protein
VHLDTAHCNPIVIQAVRDDWYFQMYFDDLPVWGFVGKVEKIIPNQVGRELGGVISVGVGRVGRQAGSTDVAPRADHRTDSQGLNTCRLTATV